MADEMVRIAQDLVNAYHTFVPGIPEVEDDGRTGWATMYGLTRCLQHELGITALSDNFGPTTLATLTSTYPSIDRSNGPEKIVRILQAAMYCKGYDGGEVVGGIFSGVFSDRTAAGVEKLKADAGVAASRPGPAVFPKLFKALLTMDAYVTVGDGSGTVRSIQQWMNATYLDRTNFFVIPCDGYFSRDVQKALMLAIQFQLGMGDDVANGVFGPKTQAGLRANTLTVGSSGRFVQLFSAAMVFNQRAGAPFTSTFTSDLSTAVRQFQDFVRLPVTGAGDYQTWASLLVSTGDPTRRGQAVDCVTEITDARAASLRAAGYQIVGRYLCNVANTSLDKELKLRELPVIVGNGLRCFPIYQTYGGEASYFSRGQGIYDAFRAIERVRFYGFKPGTRIYFAVDFDALDHEVTDHVIPHFRGIKATMDEYGGAYRLGIYGPRNICSRVAAAGLTTASFVSDMSTGFSGNLGFPMPADWAFDQISTVTTGSGAGAIEIDNDIVSGRDTGQDDFDAGDWTDTYDVSFDRSLRGAMLADLQQYLESQGVPEEGGSGLGGATTLFTTTQALDVALANDVLMTQLSRTLKMRKALIMVPIFWEVRKANLGDAVADEGVIWYHTKPDIDPTDTIVKRDCSTGLGQIFAVTAIVARNYAVRQGIISGTIMDPDRDADVWTVWKRLHDDQLFNISTAALVLIQAADDIRLLEKDPPVRIPRPSLDYGEEDTRLVLRRYQGFGSGPEADSYLKLGVYRIFEKYFGPLRA